MHRYTALAIAAALFVNSQIQAQTGKPAANAVAATVNGTPIPQAGLDRALERFSEADREKASKEILDFLIENALVDQYLIQMNISVDQKEVDARLTEIKAEIEKSNQTFKKVLDGLKMTEAEFSVQVANDLRWDKFAQSQCTDAKLKGLFDQNMDMFNGAQVRARHILLSPAADAGAQEAAKVQLLEIRRAVEETATKAVAKLPESADPLTREQERQKQIEIAFMDYASKQSVCPSKKDGGNVNWFPRVGHMVEPFSAAAFALKPYEMSQPIQTQFGYHLILCTGRKPGQEVKFEDVKDAVKEIYCSRLRDAVVEHMKKTAKIVITPKK